MGKAGLAAVMAALLAIVVGTAVAQDKTAAASATAANAAAAGASGAPLAPAIPLISQPGGQAALATPAAPLLAAIARDQRSAMPTTADDGTIVSGGRRQSFTFQQLGALDPLQLRGVESQNGVPFSVRADEVVTGATLHLIYSYSPSLMPEVSHLKVLMNGEPVATLPLPREQAGVLVSRDVPIEPRFITEFNHLNIQLIAHYTRTCEDPQNSSLWATVSNASSLDLTFGELPAKADLGALPLPFFDRRDIRRLELPFVFAQHPGTGTIEAAGIVASWFGALAGYRGALFPAQTDNAPLSGNAVVFATSDEKPAGVTLPQIEGPMLAIVDRAPPARGKLLLVMGRDERELKTAATALGIGQAALSGASETISNLLPVKPRVPYDAPNWLPTDRPVRFGELTDLRDLSVTGYHADVVRVNLRIAPDLFTWRTKGVPIDLHYRYTARPAPDRSTLNISVNNDFVQALRIPAQSSSMLDLGRYLNRMLPDNTAPAEHRIFIPPHLLTSQAQLRFHFFYDMPKTGECQGQIIDNVRGEIDPDSSIDLSSFPHYMAMPDLAAFANSGFPFTRMADLSETAVVLPNDPNGSDYSLLFAAMGRMGASTGYPVTGVTVAYAGDVDKLKDKDLLLIGAPGKQPLLATWQKAMPFSGADEGRTFQLSDVEYRLTGWWNGDRGAERAAARADLSLVSASGDALITGFESPMQKGRSVVALIGAAGQSDSDLTAALLDPDLVREIQGGMTVIHGRTLETVSNGDIYYVGKLPVVEYLRWALSTHPILLMLGGLIAALILAALCYRVLRGIAARRLGD
ncbi:cellulose biosynthesis cyclic di-GMP-binding regulatory protein BcsB [Trinickia violacea]|uniref:Cyclic di-GMP-binding protein n=1 Tax=Trinickia violacea TaxID=2571746 RepID=A0A4P8IZ44_9BURK|nr:cellulose biosynthesis cyclic di-GMP-binding regulatory protein BcsB [Trinickia violacea]QCP53717.1 cellulose biosynthesis cyclic di-GMP-binding regulatory protein BcsB [Trinickia violacea]